MQHNRRCMPSESANRRLPFTSALPTFVSALTVIHMYTEIFLWQLENCLRHSIRNSAQ